jgi:hypothetical protein
MKYFILTLATVLTLVNIQAQSLSKGYYITQKNDTITTQIRFPKGFFGQNNFTNKIEVIDSLNGEKQFEPIDIKGYGFTDKNGFKYNFLSKPTKNGSFKFLSPVYIGPKVSLYQYSVYTSGSGYSLDSSQVFYTFEKNNTEYLFVVGRATTHFKNKLKEFFQEDSKVQQAIDERINNWNEMKKDLIQILLIANRK